MKRSFSRSQFKKSARSLTSSHNVTLASRARAPFRRLRNQRGQGLVEYLVIVALMGVATIAIVRTMGSVVSSRFASVAAALQGDKVRGAGKVQIEESTYRKRDMGDFFNGVDGSKGGSRSGGSQYVGAE